MILGLDRRWAILCTLALLLGPFGWFGGPNATMWPELLAAGAVGAAVAARRQWLAAEGDRAARAVQAREDGQRGARHHAEHGRDRAHRSRSLRALRRGGRAPALCRAVPGPGAVGSHRGGGKSR